MKKESPKILIVENENSKTEYVLEGVFVEFDTKSHPGRIYDEKLYKVHLKELDKST